MTAADGCGLSGDSQASDGNRAWARNWGACGIPVRGAWEICRRPHLGRRQYHSDLHIPVQPTPKRTGDVRLGVLDPGIEQSGPGLDLGEPVLEAFSASLSDGPGAAILPAECHRAVRRVERIAGILDF